MQVESSKEGSSSKHDVAHLLGAAQADGGADLERGESGEVVDEVAAILVDHDAALLAQERLGADVFVERLNHLGGGSWRTSARTELRG